MNKVIKTKNYQQVLIWILSLTFIFSLLNVRSRGRGGGPELRTMCEVYQFSLKSVAPKVTIEYQNLPKKGKKLLEKLFLSLLTKKMPWLKSEALCKS